MRIEDLHHSELLELDPEGGVIRFAGQRALLLDAVAMGLLPLARLLLAGAAARMTRQISGFTPRAADQLLRYDWPGNVRELENAMERAVALARGSRVALDDLPEEIRQAFAKPVPHGGAVQPLRDVEKEYILAALELNEGNQTRTAGQLRIGSATLYRKRKSWGLIHGRRGRQGQKPTRGARKRPSMRRVRVTSTAAQVPENLRGGYRLEGRPLAGAAAVAA